MAKFRTRFPAQGIVLGIILLLMMLIFALVNTKFLTANNLTNILRQVSLTVITASVITFVMISGGIDLSIGGVLALAGVVAARLAVNGWPIGLALLIGMLSGTVVGMINGGLVIFTRIPPVIATLGTMYVTRGFAYVLSDGSAIVNGLPDHFGFVSESHIGFLPLIVVIMFVIFILFQIILTCTLLGKYTYAIGGSIETARFSGIKTNRIKFFLYLLAGTMAGLSGVLMASRLSSGDPNIGIGFEFDVIVAVVLGGTSLSGGEGSLLGTLIGALIVAVLANAMNLLGVGSFYQYIFQGVVLVFAVVLDLTLKTRFR